MLNKLNGQEPGDFVFRRKNWDENGEVVMWADYLFNDYIYRPDSLKHNRFYEFVL